MEELGQAGCRPSSGTQDEAVARKGARHGEVHKVVPR